MDGGTINITSSNDGIECEEGYIVINNGDILNLLMTAFKPLMKQTIRLTLILQSMEVNLISQLPLEKGLRARVP